MRRDKILEKKLLQSRAKARAYRTDKIALSKRVIGLEKKVKEIHRLTAPPVKPKIETPVQKKQRIDWEHYELLQRDNRGLKHQVELITQIMNDQSAELTRLRADIVKLTETIAVERATSAKLSQKYHNTEVKLS